MSANNESVFGNITDVGNNTEAETAPTELAEEFM